MYYSNNRDFTFHAQIWSSFIKCLWIVPRMFLVVSFLRLETVRTSRWFLKNISKMTSSGIPYNWFVIFVLKCQVQFYLTAVISSVVLRYLFQANTIFL